MELKPNRFMSIIVSKSLLIVPYGIETFLDWSKLNCADLLIVPYGIETMYRTRNQVSHYTFNRTLWN